ncbi:15418_t:CDS:2, partial [Cetraspora pellucida]
ELYAVIRALEIIEKNQNIVINTDSTYVINSIGATGIKLINSDLIDKMNDLINLRKGSQKPFVKSLNFNLSNKRKIDFYFTKKEQTDNSDIAQDSYLNEFFHILTILENDKDQK